MARIRTIKPEFPQSESMGRVSRESRLCFMLLWTLADDSGRLRGNSRMLASLLYPYDDDAGKLMDGWLLELERESCIVRYLAEGDTYLQVCNWLKHQKIDKPSASKIPEFDESSRILSNPLERSSGDLRIKDQGSKDQGALQRSFESSIVDQDRSQSQQAEGIKNKKGTFVPPSLLEVQNHMQEIGSSKTEAHRYFNHYESNGWMVGKNKMKNWKAAASGWVSRNLNGTPAKKPDTSLPAELRDAKWT